MFYDLFSELNPDLKYKKGYVFVVKIIPFKNYTSYLLAKHTKNTSETKARPIIILKKEAETVKIFALSTFKDLLGKRPVFDISKCDIKKKKEECFNISFDGKEKNLVFAKRNKRKNYRVFYEINIHTLDSLMEGGNLEYCGKCNEDQIDETEKIIQKFFEGI